MGPTIVEYPQPQLVDHNNASFTTMEIPSSFRPPVDYLVLIAL